MTWESDCPKDADGGWFGLQISIRVAPRDWPAALERVPVEHRPRAEAYLRGVAARLKARRHAQRSAD